MLLAIDEDGKGLLINRKRRVLLHHISFAERVTAAAFSPDGAFIACAVGRLLQVPLQPYPFARGLFFSPKAEQNSSAQGGLLAWQIWRAPSKARLMAPLQLHRSFGGCTGSISAIDWSADAQWIVAGSRDLTCRCLTALPRASTPMHAGFWGRQSTGLVCPCLQRVFHQPNARLRCANAERS